MNYKKGIVVKAMRRSGHHPIINVIAHLLTNETMFLEQNNTKTTGYWNRGKRDREGFGSALVFNALDTNPMAHTPCKASQQWRNCQEYHTVVVVRSFHNWLASRMAWRNGRDATLKYKLESLIGTYRTFLTYNPIPQMDRFKPMSHFTINFDSWTEKKDSTVASLCSFLGVESNKDCFPLDEPFLLGAGGYGSEEFDTSFKALEGTNPPSKYALTTRWKNFIDNELYIQLLIENEDILTEYNTLPLLLAEKVKEQKNATD